MAGFSKMPFLLTIVLNAEECASWRNASSIHILLRGRSNHFFLALLADLPGLSLQRMHKYFLKTPWWVRTLFSSYVWRMPGGEKTIYLTFDDGPHPTITPWVLNELKKYTALATFFCIGKNVEQFPDVYQKIKAEGHAVGNHTYTHPNGWKTPDEDYLADVKKAGALIDSELFRPPYGRIRRGQAKRLASTLKKANVTVVMWDVLSADFDRSVTPEACAKIVLDRVEAGSVVVFHDSDKAFPNLQYALPRVLEKFSKEGFSFQKL
jgi:peptidoglycan/xylan/chitin deacetylase (PgdA/CDA1 family)